MQIVVDEGGSVEFTRKPHLLELLHSKDRKRVERMTDILFDEKHQKYYIKFLKGPFAGLVLPHQPYPWPPTSRQDELYGLWKLFFTDYSPGIFVRMTSAAQYVLMHSYEDAVNVEVAFVEFLRDMGYSMK